jgi:transcriptional regulator with XRE-family HTH domain
MSELGSALIRAREARGLTLEDAERDTRISRRYLQALETEQFEAIPAPVYARGFLRSYSQYLGLDPAEMLALFPRDEDTPYAPDASSRPTGQPPSAVGPQRPAWQRPSRGVEPASALAEETALEPTIGVDIGVASPARRIKADPAAQMRTIAVAGVAIATVVIVVVIALFIANLGGGSDATPTPKPGASGATLTQTAQAGGGAPAPSGPSGLPVVRGTVPDVKGQPVATARLAITEAGYTINEKHQSSSAARGTIIDQAPAPGIQQEGGQVIIVVSDGP